MDCGNIFQQFELSLPLFKNQNIMTTLEIQVTNDKALRLLEDLEALQLLRIVKHKRKKTPKLSEQLAGALPSEVAEEMQKYITKCRNEWNRDI